MTAMHHGQHRFLPMGLFAGLAKIGHAFGGILKRPAGGLDVEQDSAQFRAHHRSMLLIVAKPDVSASLSQIVREIVGLIVALIAGLVEPANRFLPALWNRHAELIGAPELPFRISLIGALATA